MKLIREIGFLVLGIVSIPFMILTVVFATPVVWLWELAEQIAPWKIQPSDDYEYECPECGHKEEE